MTTIKLLAEAREHYLGQLLAEDIAHQLRHDDIEQIINDDLKQKIARIDALLLTGGWIPPTDKPPHLPGELHSKDVLLLMKKERPNEPQRIVIGHVSIGHWRPVGGNGNFGNYVDGWQDLPPLPEDKQ